MQGNRQHMPKIVLTWTLSFPFSLVSSHPPLSFFILFVFSLYLDPPLFVVASLNPSARLLPESCHLFPSLQPHESRGISWLWHREAPRMHKWCLGFPSFIFQEACWSSLMAGSRWAFCKCSRWLAASLVAQTQGLRSTALEF